jgi:hypothetical protein
MLRLSRVKLFKQVKINGKWTLAVALFDSKGRVRKDHVLVKGKDENRPEGSYFIEWWENGQRHREAVGAHAQDAVEKTRIKQAELAAIRNGVIPALPAIEETPKRTVLAVALDGYSEYVRYHRSLRTFRTYRPILESFKAFCQKTHVDDVERQDLLDFATDCMKQGQKGKSIYNKLVVLSQVMKQHGRPKLLNAADWPSFVETVRPIYEDFELAKLFKACTPSGRGPLQVLSHVRFSRRRGAVRYVARCRFQAHGCARDCETTLGISSQELGGARGPSSAKTYCDAPELPSRQRGSRRSAVP